MAGDIMNGASMPALEGGVGATLPVYEEDLPVILDQFRKAALFYGALVVIEILASTLATCLVWLKSFLPVDGGQF